MLPPRVVQRVARRVAQGRAKDGAALTVGVRISVGTHYGDASVTFVGRAR